MTKYWIICSKHSRDEATQSWGSKWTADGIIKNEKYFPPRKKWAFSKGDKSLLYVFGSKHFIGNFTFNSDHQTDDEKDVWYRIGDIEKWDFPVHQHTLPSKYRGRLSRNTAIEISEHDYHELLGIRNFTKNLRINYRDRLNIKISEKDLEDLIDAKNALRSRGLEIIERQYQASPGNIIDLLCQDTKGDLVVVELKKGSANETIGQLSRYITDVREHFAKPRQKVHGMILAFDIDEQLIKAADGVDFEVVLVQLSFI